MRYVSPFNRYFEEEPVEVMSNNEIRYFLDETEEDEDYFSNLAYGNWGEDEKE